MLETDQDDAQWEFWKSNKIQECKIFYENNIATRKIGVIFVHSQVRSIWGELQGAARKEKAKEVYIQVRSRKTGKSEEECENEFNSLSEESK